MMQIFAAEFEHNIKVTTTWAASTIWARLKDGKWLAVGNVPDSVISGPLQSYECGETR